MGKKRRNSAKEASAGTPPSVKQPSKLTPNEPALKRAKAAGGSAPADKGAASSATSAEEGSVGHVWTCDSADHCETPLLAYEHIVPLLRRLATRLKIKPASLKIYDPYFCAGGIVDKLGQLGFKNVINENTDFYAAQERGAIPDFDVIVTNPPYSGDHVARCLTFCRETGLPWLALLPSFVLTKEYYEHMNLSPLFVVPAERYVYASPAALRPELRAAARATAPYFSFWYVDLCAHTNACAASEVDRGTYGRIDRKGQAPSDEELKGRPLLCWTSKQLPQRVRDQNDPARRRLRKKQRDRLKKKTDNTDARHTASVPSADRSTHPAKSSHAHQESVAEPVANWAGLHRRFDD